MENTVILTEDEQSLLTHISRWGSDGYPVHKIGRGWSWSYRGINGPPVIFKTKREATASFEAYHQILIDRYAMDRCDAHFREVLGAIAHANDSTLEAVFMLWRKYARDCSNYDQSPVVFEFCQWNNLREVN